MRTNGAVEGIQTFVTNIASSLARFDDASHILPSYQVAGECMLYAEKPVKGCSAHYAGGNASAGTSKKKSASPRVQALDYLLGK